MLDLRLLGPLEARRDGQPVPLRGVKPRALLADLALEPGRVVSVDRLVDDLWGENAPESATHAIEVYVSQLRKVLGRDAIVTRAPGYALELARGSLDLQRFVDLAEEAHACGDPTEAAGLYGAALALWRGPALADFTYDPFAQVEIARLEELRQSCLEGRLEADLALGHGGDLVAELEALVAAHPLRERLRALLMLALYRSGRQADALAAYRAARETLVEELGIDPSPALRELEAAILSQDEALLVHAPAKAAPAAAPEQRKLVTILFADLVDSMGLAASLDPEAFHRVLQRYYTTIETVLHRHGAAVEKFAGDAAMAAFGIPVAHEDDALRAARGALELQASCEALELEVRIGIESGEVLAGDASGGQRFVTGEAVGLAARLEQHAGAGEIAVGAAAARLIAHVARLEPLEPIALRGRTSPLPAFRLLELADAAPALERRLDGPLVGRDRELEALREAVAAGRRTVLLVGPAGIGKSRLAAELAAEADATVRYGQCLSYGEGITYWPLRTIVPADELDQILAGPSAGEIARAFRHYCERLAQERPLLLVLDDLHWAEPTFLELVEDLARRSTGRITVLGLAREELLEEHPDFVPDRLVLEPLDRGESETMLESLAGGTAVSAETRAQLVEAAEGNPLFLEQLLAFGAEQGGLAAERTLPRSIQALLAARLDRLGPGERAVLERAAVVGKEFREHDVAALLEAAAAGTVGRHLRTLATRGFVRRGDADEFRFRHGLIQEAAYRSTPKATRASLHERLADRLAGAEDELDELIGYHLECAHNLRRELGESDRNLRLLAADAGARLGVAGIRATKRHDLAAAVNLLGRAAALLVADDALRRELLCELSVALLTRGDPGEAERAFDEAIRSAMAGHDGRIELRARVERARIQLIRDPSRSGAELLDVAGSAIPTLETLGDHRALGRAWLLIGFVHGGLHGRHTAWKEAAEHALAHYRQAGWPVATCLGQIAAALYYGPAPVAEAIERCRTLLWQEASDSAGRANVLVFLGGLEAMEGRFADARRLLDEATAIFVDIGQVAASAVIAGAVRADVELLAQDDAAAEAVLSSTCETLGRLHENGALSTRASDLAEALYRQGRHDDAEYWADVAAACGGADDLSTQPLWRAVKAKLLARRGALDDALALAAEAVQIADRTEALNRRARVALDFAEVLRLAGRQADAFHLVQEADALYERKGNIVGTEQTRAFLQRGKPLEGAFTRRGAGRNP